MVKTQDKTLEYKSNRIKSLIGKEFPVLNKGFIMLVDYMGNDSSIVQAARTSYGKGTTKTRNDEKLIRYLLRHQHTTPFEMVEFKFLIKAPLFVARQWHRHRTASINEYSGRYSEMLSDYYIPNLKDIQAQSKSNRQGKEEGTLSSSTRLSFQNAVISVSDDAYATYTEYLNKGVAKELARMILPVNFYTQWYWKSNLHNTFHFLKLRMDPHAQQEIREYANTMADIVKIAVPTAYKAFEDFTLNNMSFSSKETEALKYIMNGTEIAEACKEAGINLRKTDGSPAKQGEGPEFLKKLEDIKNQ